MPPTFRAENRALVQALWRRGIRSPTVIFKDWRISYRTARRYLARMRAGDTLEDRPRSGRPRKLTTALFRRLARLKSEHPKKASAWYARRLSEGGNEHISSRSVQRALQTMGYTWRLRPRRRLTPSQKRARCAFARAHLYDSWDNRWFFDEAYFNLYRHSNKYWVGAETDDAMELPKLTEAQEKVSVGIAVAVRRGRKSALAFLPKNWKASDLVNAFKDVLLPSMQWRSRIGKHDELVVDNDGRHYSTAWLDFVQHRALSPVRPWSPNSPDFNVIENIFAWLKAKVEDMGPTDEQSLRDCIRTAWDALPLSMTETLVESMPRRLALAVKLNGGRTKY